MINPWQHQIVLGALFGSGYLQRARNRLCMGISESRDLNWFDYKSVELESLSARKPINQARGVWKWRGKSCEMWESYRTMFYNDHSPTMNMVALDQMQDIGFAIWFGDKGFWYSSRRVALRASKFDTRDPALGFFNEVGLPCEEKRKSIVFTPVGTERFLRLIEPRLPHYMLYKLSATQESG